MIRSLSNSSTEARDFLKFVREDLKAHRVHLRFTNTRMVRMTKGQPLVQGFFAEPLVTRWGIIKIPMRNKRHSTILANLAHEYCHFLQWKSNDRDYNRHDGIGNSYVRIEEKTEASAIALLKEWNIPLNYRAVKRRSNAYLAHLRESEINN